jgi:hypothetical protein
MSQDEFLKLTPDDRCRMVPSFIGFLYRIYRYIGFTDAELNSIHSGIFQQMLVSDTTVDNTLLISAETVPSKGNKAYQVSLIADEVMNRFGIGDGGLTTLEAAQVINERTSKLNPRIHWLAQNRTATEYGAYLIKKYCKPQRPFYGMWAVSGNTRAGLGNSTEYFLGGGSIDSVAYQYLGATNSWGVREQNIGLDCIGWINLYLENSEWKDLKCEVGEKLIDGACQTIAFARPIVAPFPGLGYAPKMGTTSIIYAPVNFNTCPWGGQLVVSPPNQTLITNYCEITHAVSSTNIYKPGKNYWIDIGAFTSGVYTDLVNGSCQSNETLVNGSCRAYAFPLPTPMLYNGVKYRVDNTLTNAGVYYPKVNNSCPYGGTISGSDCKIYSSVPGKLKTTYDYFIRRDYRNPGIYHYPLVVPRSKFFAEEFSTNLKSLQ